MNIPRISDATSRFMDLDGVECGKAKFKITIPKFEAYAIGYASDDVKCPMIRMM